MATGKGSMTHAEVNSVCKSLEHNMSVDKTSPVHRGGSKAASSGSTSEAKMSKGGTSGGKKSRRSYKT